MDEPPIELDPLDNFLQAASAPDGNVHAGAAVSNSPTNQTPADAVVGFDPIDAYKVHAQAEIEKSKQQVANWIALITVVGLLLSLVVAMASLAVLPQQTETVVQVFERWLTAIGPIAGAAVGFGVAVRKRAADD